MSVRAARSEPSAQARRSPRPARAIPSRQKPSVIGFANGETNGSMHCTRASSPAWAVTDGGTPRVSSGSTSATTGSMDGDRRLTFTWSAVEVTTPLAVTSEPVPEVVGTATTGKDASVSGWPRPITSA